MQVVVDSLLTRYHVSGKGKTILLLHGWGDSAAGMQGLQDALIGGCRVIVLDLPGFGGTQAPLHPWALDDYAQFVAHFLQKIEVRHVHLLLGHSNGGAIAVRGLAKGWLQADKLVLLATAGIRGVYKGRVKALRYVTKVGKALTTPLPKSVKSRLRKTVYNTVGSDMLVAEHLQETFKRVVTDDVRADAAALSLPTLLIYGEQDDATPVWYGEAFHELIGGSTLEILPGAGHFVHIDRAKDVERAVREFAA
ncbi:MAG TPA: alpha/beta hydrolase [Candidatus Saccharimonadales bacterium]|nr:alpha/beta hydrolase [Candidatus Saccharimonadales bacterium]